MVVRDDVVRIWCLLSLVFATTVSCFRDTREATGPVPRVASEVNSDNNDILVVLFRRLVSVNKSSIRETAEAYVVSVGEGDTLVDPDPTVLGALEDCEPPTVAASRAEIRGDGVYLRGSERRSLLLFAKILAQPDSSTVVATGGYVEDGLGAARFVWLLRRTPSGWRIESGCLLSVS